MAAIAAQTDLPVVIDIAEDRLKVVVSERPGQSLKALDAPLIIAKLRDLGVKLDTRGEAEVHELCRPRKGNRAPAIVARGTPPVDDTPARVEPIQTDQVIPRHVQTGEPLAKLVPPELGRDGLDVYGQQIPRRCVEAKPSVDPSLNLDVDGSTYVSTMDGMLRIRGAESSTAMFVVSGHRHTGNLTPANGPLDFAGDVSIEGNVQAGAVIRAGGSIQVGGEVEAAEITTASDLHVAGGIVGREKAKYTIAGDVCARNLRGITLDVGGDVTAKAGIESAYIVCRGLLKVEQGALVASHVSAAGGLQCQILGSSTFTKTVIEVGTDARFRRLAPAVLQDIASRRARSAKVRQAIEPLLRNPKTLTSQQQARVAELVREADEMEIQARQLQADLRREYQAAIAHARSEISIGQIAHPGVTLRFPGAQTTLRMALKGPCRIVCQPCNGKLCILLYEGSKPTPIPLELRHVDEDWLEPIKKMAA